MVGSYSQIDINSYVAKYMDETGCDFQQACKDLEIDSSTVFSNEKSE